MSRVANKPIEIPNNVEVNINAQDVKVKGPKGELAHLVHPAVAVNLDEQELKGKQAKVVLVKLRDGRDSDRAQAGTVRALLNNMVVGVSEGFSKKLLLVGVGYRVQVKGKTLALTLGFSHPVSYTLPEGVSAEAPSTTELIISGIDKQKVGQAAAEIRAFRPPEPYKGKGIRYHDEQIIRKETKK